MADYLVDTNILLRRLQRTSPQHQTARRALRALYEQGHTLYVTSQVLQELWSVATRTAARGGLALTPRQAERHVRRTRQLFQFLPDVPAIYFEWESLVSSLGITDAEVFDARLIAAMRVYGLAHLLTFNLADFAAFTEITIVDPRTL